MYNYCKEVFYMYFLKRNYCCEPHHGLGLFFIFGIVGAFLTFVSIVTAVYIFMDKKRRKEDKQVKDYLDNSIQ
ncbi:MAG: hypothetical protein RsTaC01_1020 [Candidatus Paraimprobicoccus trichonymphae]|uniref:Uncharacterized protein n=1 Tax=Candidatus Paraimprobicoccus trichonymphae TaxID=3033793 RepID=A0AA48I0H5_9FIRM|nr:MAG: hypothetical protein RsTaC01_1020 [Candidatus Paraimprobicoccus trichonymphae]